MFDLSASVEGRSAIMEKCRAFRKKEGLAKLGLEVLNFDNKIIKMTI